MVAEGLYPGQGSLEGVSVESGVFRGREEQSPGEGFSEALVLEGRVQVGGSSSSQDVFNCFDSSPRGNTGASSSHGMPASLPSVCYEDYFPLDENPGFPLVGTWLVVHYLVQVFSVVGTGVLEFLGLRAASWCTSRTTSAYLRFAVAAAVADLLRAGPYGVAFQGPQWMSAVEHYICRGEILGYGRVPADSALSPVPAGPVFPYVHWGPPNVTHFLWRLFAVQGYLLLSLLGNRVKEWAYLRATASDFRSNIVLSLIMWLRATGPYRTAEGTVTFEAAAAYLATGERQYPFLEEEDEDVDRRPHRGPREPTGLVRPLFAVPEESSSGSGTSTTEPSVVSASASSECEPVLPDGAEPCGPGDGLPVLGYSAAEGALIVAYGDDSFEVPLPSWPLEVVQAVVVGLETGVWADWSEFLQGGPGVALEEANPSQRLQIIRYGRLWGRWARLLVFVGLALAFLLYGMTRAGAEEICFGDDGATEGQLQLYQPDTAVVSSSEGLLLIPFFQCIPITLSLSVRVRGSACVLSSPEYRKGIW